MERKQPDRSKVLTFFAEEVTYKAQPKYSGIYKLWERLSLQITVYIIFNMFSATTYVWKHQRGEKTNLENSNSRWMQDHVRYSQIKDRAASLRWLSVYVFS